MNLRIFYDVSATDDIKCMQTDHEHERWEKMKIAVRTISTRQRFELFTSRVQVYSVILCLSTGRNVTYIYRCQWLEATFQGKDLGLTEMTWVGNAGMHRQKSRKALSPKYHQTDEVQELKKHTKFRLGNLLYRSYLEDWEWNYNININVTATDFENMKRMK
jgi:hypothetical protein